MKLGEVRERRDIVLGFGQKGSDEVVGEVKGPERARTTIKRVRTSGSMEPEEERGRRREGGTNLSFVSFSNPSRWLILLS